MVAPARKPEVPLGAQPLPRSIRRLAILPPKLVVQLVSTAVWQLREEAVVRQIGIARLTPVLRLRLPPLYPTARLSLFLLPMYLRLSLLRALTDGSSAVLRQVPLRDVARAVTSAEQQVATLPTLARLGECRKSSLRRRKTLLLCSRSLAYYSSRAVSSSVLSSSCFDGMS